MTFDLSIIFDIPECQYFAALRCHVAFSFKIRNHRALRCKQRCVASKTNVAFAFKIRNHRALRCFLYLSKKKQQIQCSVVPKWPLRWCAKFPGCTVFKYRLRSGDEKD